MDSVMNWAKSHPKWSLAIGALAALTVFGAVAGESEKKPDKASADTKTSNAETKKKSEFQVKAEKRIEWEDCKRQFTPLLDALSSVESDLTVGVTVGDYGEAVRDANRTYSEVMNSGDFGGVTCLKRVGVPAERAMKTHIKTYNAWSKCATDYECDTSAMDARRQRLWRQASSSTNRAASNLVGMEP